MVSPTGGTPGYTYQWDAAAGNQTTQTATGLCIGNYCVTITDSSSCILITCIDVLATGIVENSLSTPFEVYPNPTTSLFKVDGAVGIISIYNLFGMVVLESTKKEIDLSGHASGVYFIKVGEAVRKLIKQ